MAEREPISKKLRFEVFKRDSFTCQYCGSKAPDVILHVDHINPVSKGGGNDILNLITACSSCNGGKSDRLLGDHVEIEKQRAQLEELNERREQLEGLLAWRTELQQFEGERTSKIADLWHARVPGYSLNASGLSDLGKWERRFGLELLLDCINAAADQYLKYDGDELTSESVNHAFNMIPRIAGAKQVAADKPYMRDVYYIRGILRNRLSYLNEGRAMQIIREAILLGADPESLKQWAKEASSWTRFREEVEQYIVDNQPSDQE